MVPFLFPRINEKRRKRGFFSVVEKQGGKSPKPVKGGKGCFSRWREKKWESKSFESDFSMSTTICGKGGEVCGTTDR